MTNVVRNLRLELEDHTVTHSSFAIDRTEVSVAEYMRCVASGGRSPLSFTRGDARFDLPMYPVTQSSWRDASSYCRWAGGRLPTELVWVYPSRSTTANTFQWGNLCSFRHANHGS